MEVEVPPTLPETLALLQAEVDVELLPMLLDPNKFLNAELPELVGLVLLPIDPSTNPLPANGSTLLVLAAGVDIEESPKALKESLREVDAVEAVAVAVEVAVLFA